MNEFQKRDLNPYAEDWTATWTQRLGPLGNPDWKMLLKLGEVKSQN